MKPELTARSLIPPSTVTSIKMLNVGMRTGMHFYQYNEKTHKIEKKDGSGLVPNISYKIYF